jgi:hypothetical protein
LQDNVLMDAASEARRGWRAILWGGLLAGVLDIGAAFAVYGLRGATPVRILQSIAAGLLGVAAFQGGLGTAALGALLHFVIAFGAAAVYYAASRKWRVLVQWPVVAGLLYGVGVYLFMNYVVVPLSAVPKRPFVLGLAAIILVVHMLFVGLPIALAVSRCARLDRRWV